MILFAILAACDADVEGVYAACEQERTDLATDASTSLGFAPADVLTWLEGDFPSSLTYEDGTAATDVTVTVASTGAASFVDQSEAADTGGSGETPAIAAVCEDYLEIGLTVSLTSADGAFAETWDVTLPVTEVSRGQVTIEPEAFAGTFVVPESVSAGCDTSHVQLDLFFTETGGSAGQLWLACETNDGETVSEGLKALAAWGDPEEG